MKHFYRAFIDDIIIFFATFEEHINHLFLIFQRLLEYDIKLNSSKAFLNFSFVALLDQHVDDFDYHTTKNKIVAILNWKFSTILKTLEIYLEFIDWLRDYVAWYAQKTKSLQQKKTLLLKSSSFNKEFDKKAYFAKAFLKNSSDRERKFFDLIQDAFKNSRFLTHFNVIRQFLIDVNAFKEEFEAFVYHIKKKRDEMIKSTAIESIVSLSKTLTSIEKRYWSIELEVIAVVWVVKKLHHMIKAFKHSTIVWTDHSITATIVKQIKMFISSIDKLNLRLIRVDMYLSQFDLNVRHKFDRDHIISNISSRLSSWDDNLEKFENTLKDVNVYVETLIEMFSDFKTRLINVYKIDKEWSTLYIMLKALRISIQATRRDIVNTQTNATETSQDTSAKHSINSEFFTHEDIEFERRDDLIYHLDRITSKTRSCISKSFIKEIFAMIHDKIFHAEFHRVYVTISETFYVRRLSHYLRKYIAYCSQCLLNQTKRHKSYDAFNSISILKISFHTITMNFVLTLSSFNRMKYDIMLIVTNKFFKTKLLISDRNNWNAKNWTATLWKYLQLFNWDLSRVIIFDKDAKFRFDMWKSLFKAIKTDLLTSTIYHSQIDDQSERTNQTIEIALRYLVTSNSNLSWHEALSSLQHDLMNFVTFTSFTSNQTLYEINIRLSLMILNDHTVDSTLSREFIRVRVLNMTTAWVRQ
jgi:hypothetical protein